MPCSEFWLLLLTTDTSWCIMIITLVNVTSQFFKGEIALVVGLRLYAGPTWELLEYSSKAMKLDWQIWNYANYWLLSIKCFWVGLVTWKVRWRHFWMNELGWVFRAVYDCCRQLHIPTRGQRVMHDKWTLIFWAMLLRLLVCFFPFNHNSSQHAVHASASQLWTAMTQWVKSIRF